MSKSKIITKRIPLENRKPDKFYYELKHDDGDINDKNLRVEKDVLINFYGTLELDFELDFSNQDPTSYKEAITFKEFRKQEKEYLEGK